MRIRADSKWYEIKDATYKGINSLKLEVKTRRDSSFSSKEKNIINISKLYKSEMVALN